MWMCEPHVYEGADKSTVLSLFQSVCLVIGTAQAGEGVFAPAGNMCSATLQPTETELHQPC